MWSDVVARYKAHGVHFKHNDGVTLGKLSTTLPLKFRTAAVQYVLVNVAYFFFAGFVLDSSLENNDLVTAGIGLIWLWVLFLYYPQLLFFGGKKFKITDTHFQIGLSRYQLADMGAFTTQEIHGKHDQHIIGFHYGRSSKEIHVRNTFEDQIEIIQDLNDAIQQAKAGASVNTDRVTARSAEF